ncbi:DHA2 family efflux MFS transporter permease subunit [Nonomuraea angiospora]|uniref:DHA2 family multidrug resistance protein-like MFS transporter n=1 Tax=Nonomuraea angiospora TaxID=46172 RepID=A0ABR9MDP9_9ACTN|nr:DHA2 family efflux MFS transporter permease subunit [Nonomuraea angiospora]MBE1591039.1 DHA2 family multidrug resistance protein-like MFS transporter [Nonomuraea angiospora]
MKNKWSCLAIACLATLLLSLDLTVLHLALPRLVTDLGANSTQLLWIGDMYGFALAGLLVTMGNLGDRIGRKRLLLIGAAAFGAASVVTAYAPNAELLIAARALLGVAGATIMPSTLSIVRNVFTEPGERTAAIGIWSGMSAAGFAVGPVVGGLLLDHFWWGSVFLINVPIMLLVLAGGALVLPESRNPHAGRPDLVSVVLSFAGVVTAVYAIKEAAHQGLEHADVLVAGAAGVLLLGLFVWRQTRLREPLIDVRLFRRRAFSASIVTNLLAIFTMSAMMLMFGWYLQLVLGWSPLQAGLAQLPGGLSGAVGGILAAKLIHRIGRNGVVALGLAMNAGAFLYYSTLGPTLNYLVLLPVMIIGGVGIGFTFTVNNDNVLATAPRERAGAAAAVSETAFELGGALGIAILGTVLNTAYQSNLQLPPGLPSADSARESIAGAVSTAATLPPQQADQLMRAAQTAFIEGLHMTALVTAALLAIVTVLALIGLRGVPKVIPEEVLTHA